MKNSIFKFFTYIWYSQLNNDWALNDYPMKNIESIFVPIYTSLGASNNLYQNIIHQQLICTFISQVYLNKYLLYFILFGCPITYLSCTVVADICFTCVVDMRMICNKIIADNCHVVHSLEVGWGGLRFLDYVKVVWFHCVLLSWVRGCWGCLRFAEACSDKLSPAYFPGPLTQCVYHLS